MAKDTELPPTIIKIKEKIHAAILGKRTEEAEALKYLLSILETERLRKGSLSDNEAGKLLYEEMKRKKEALALFKKGKRDDLLEKEEREIEILEQFLPEQASEEEIRKLVKEIIAENGKENFSLIMGKAMRELKGKADGSVVSGIVQEELR